MSTLPSEAPWWLSVALLGLGGTASMDLFSWLLSRGFGIPAPDWALIGRWVGHWRRGQWRHDAIGRAPALRGEVGLGWLVHYLVGLLLAAGFVALAGRDWLAAPSPAAAIGYGAITVMLPFFILQPALGAGIAARRTPQPNRVRLRSLANHLVYGAGMYLGAFLLAAVLP